MADFNWGTFLTGLGGAIGGGTGTTSGTTTGTQQNATSSLNTYLPYILIGGVALVAVLMLKK